MFNITGKSGFHITFANGYTVSVQWGPGTYSENHNLFHGDMPTVPPSATAECAVWPESGGMLVYGDWGDTVGNRMTPAEVLALMVWAEAQ